MCSESVALFPAGFYDWPYEGCKGKGISGNVRWLEGRWFTAERAEHPLGSFSKCFSLENPQLCVLAQNHWVGCVATHVDFQYCPLLDFCLTKVWISGTSSTFDSGESKVARSVSSFATQFVCSCGKQMVEFQTKRGFVASGGVNQKAMRASALSGVLPL